MQETRHWSHDLNNTQPICDFRQLIALYAAKMTQCTPIGSTCCDKRARTEKVLKRDHHVQFTSSAVVEFKHDLPSNVRSGLHTAIYFSFHTIYSRSQLANFDRDWRQEWIARGNPIENFERWKIFREYAKDLSVSLGGLVVPQGIYLKGDISEALSALILFNWLQLQTSLIKYLHLSTVCNVSLPKVSTFDIVPHFEKLEQENRRNVPECLFKEADINNASRQAIRSQLKQTFLIREGSETMIDFLASTSQRIEQLQYEIDILSMKLRLEQVPSVFGVEGYAFGRKWLSVAEYLKILSVEDLLVLIQERDLNVATKSHNLVNNALIKITSDELVATHELFAGKPLKLMSLKELKMEAHLRNLAPKEKHIQHKTFYAMNEQKNEHVLEKKIIKRGLKKRNRNVWISLLHV